MVVIVHGALTVHIYRSFPDFGKSFDRQYTNISEHLYRDGVYSTGERDSTGTLLPTISEPPLYTGAYALSYNIFGITRAADEAMRILQVVLNILTILVCWRIGRLWSTTVGNAAATLAAHDFTAFYFANNFQIPDTTLGFFVALALFYLVKFLKDQPSPKNISLTGFFLGLAMWTKIAAYLLWIPIAVLLMFFLWSAQHINRRERIRLCTVFIFIIVLFFGGWKLRNYSATGYFSFSSGATSLRWNASHLIAYQQGITRSQADKELAKQYLTQDVSRMPEGAQEKYLSGKLAGLILHSPIDFSLVVLKAMPGMFLGTFPPYILSSQRQAEDLMKRLRDAHGFRTLFRSLWDDGYYSYVLLYFAAKAHLIFLYSMSIVAMVVFARNKSLRWILAAFLLTIVYTMTVSGAAAQARYRTIIFPVFYVLGGYGVIYCLETLHSRRQRGHSVLV